MREGGDEGGRDREVMREGEGGRRREREVGVREGGVRIGKREECTH